MKRDLATRIYSRRAHLHVYGSNWSGLASNQWGGVRRCYGLPAIANVYCYTESSHAWDCSALRG